MNYKRYIAGVPLVSEIGLGTWQLGHNSGWQAVRHNLSGLNPARTRLAFQK